MASRFICPYLQAEVELTEEREHHIAERHPDLLPDHRGKLTEVLADPDIVRRSIHAVNARMFSRWYTGLRSGCHVVVVVMNDVGDAARHWIVTAYVARRLAGGEVEWQRS